MNLRPSEGLTPTRVRDSGVDILARELLEERAAALGRAGRAVESRLQALRDSPDNKALVQAAADAVQRLMIQREACGLRNHLAVLDEYRVPRAVVARIGARPKDQP